MFKPFLPQSSSKIAEFLNFLLSKSFTFQIWKVKDLLNKKFRNSAIFDELCGKNGSKNLYEKSSQGPAVLRYYKSQISWSYDKNFILNFKKNDFAQRRVLKPIESFKRYTLLTTFILQLKLLLIWTKPKFIFLLFSLNLRHFEFQISSTPCKFFDFLQKRFFHWKLF